MTLIYKQNMICSHNNHHTSSSILCNGGVGRIKPGSNGVSTEESVVAIARKLNTLGSSHIDLLLHSNVSAIWLTD